MAKPKPIVVMLTDEQDQALTPFIRELEAMASVGKPGILAAQIFPGHMRVGIISYEAGVEAIKAAGGDTESRIRVAPELAE